MSAVAAATDAAARAAGLVTRVVERAAVDGSTCVSADVVAAALRSAGVADPAPGAQHAFESGAVAAYAEERLFGHATWAEYEDRVAQVLVRLVSVERGLTVVRAARGSDPEAVVRPIEAAAGQCVRTRGDSVAAGTELATADLVVVERADLLGLADAADALGSLREGCRLVLVGDPGLPPAPGPGRLLPDVVDSGVVPVVDAPPAGDEPPDPLAQLVRSLHAGALPPLNPDRREVVVTPAGSADEAVRRTGQLVTTSIPRVLGIPAAETQVLAPRAGGRTGAEALRAALASAGAADVEVRTCAEAVGRGADAIVLLLGAEAAGSLTRDLLVGAATEARRHLSVVHQAGPALAEAVALRPHRPRRTRLAQLLTDGRG